MLLFMRPANKWRVISTLQRYALTDDHQGWCAISWGTHPLLTSLPL